MIVYPSRYVYTFTQTQCTLYLVQCTMYTVQCTWQCTWLGHGPHSLQCILSTGCHKSHYLAAYSTVYIIDSTVYSVYYIMYSVHCVQCTLCNYNPQVCVFTVGTVIYNWCIGTVRYILYTYIHYYIKYTVY